MALLDDKEDKIYLALPSVSTGEEIFLVPWEDVKEHKYFNAAYRMASLFCPLKPKAFRQLVRYYIYYFSERKEK